MNTQTLEAAPPLAPAMPPEAAIFQLMFGKHIAYSLSTVAGLAVADQMSDVPTSVEELAQRVGAHAPSLYRVMRLLASVGVFTEHAGKKFSLTPVGELLKTDVPGSFRHLAIFMGGEIATRAFGHLTDSVRTGVSGVRAEYGKDAFDLFAAFPDEAEMFHRGMANFSAVVGPAIADAYDFSGIDCIADVGGGHGMLLATIVRRHPGMRGVLYDLPEVVAGAPASGCIAGMEDRVQIESGSFLERVPAGCDAYILKHIIHDWSDEICTQILCLIREQLPAQGRVLVCEMVVPDDSTPAPAKLLDIEMLAFTVGGRERTRDEFADLFASAGLRLERVVPTRSPVSVLEARLG
jgi:O-methyltransferase domain